MKKILSIFLCLIFICSIVSCDTKEHSSENNDTEENTVTTVKSDEIQIATPKPATDYKKAYLDFLKDKQESHRLFALVFIDNDDIPELYLKGSSEAECDMVCSFKNGSIIKHQLNRTGGGKYTPRSGDMINQNGNMGRCYTNVYKLNDSGFTKTFNALSVENVEHIGEEEYNFIYEYFVEDAPVSEAEYNIAVNSAFDFSQAVRLDENAVSYDEIVQQLQNS